VLANVRRLLKPGGLFISKTPGLSDMGPLIPVMVFGLRLIGKAPTVSFFRAAALERQIEAAGFAIEERALHKSKGRDTRPFLVARRSA